MKMNLKQTVKNSKRLSRLLPKKYAIVIMIALLAIGAYGINKGSEDGLRPSFFENEKKLATVTRVIDGDTFVAVLDEEQREEKIRLIGVDTPEDTKVKEVGGKEATAFTESLLYQGRKVTLELDEEPYDRYGRLLAYVWLTEGVSVEEGMLQGILLNNNNAEVMIIKPNDKYQKILRKIEGESK